MRVDTSIVGYEFKMIFTERTFSLRWQLHDGLPTFFFLAPIFFKISGNNNAVLSINISVCNVS